MKKVAEKILVSEMDGEMRIFFDENFYNVDQEEMAQISLSSIMNGETTGCNLSRLEYGEIICHTNPARIEISATKRTVKAIIDYILKCASTNQAES